MNLAGVPEYQITGLCTDFDSLAAFALEPLDIFFGEPEPVCRAPRLLAILVRGEILFTERARTLHHNQSAVVRAIGGEVEQPLDALEALAQRALVDVRPGAYGRSIRRRQCQIHAIKRDEQLVCSPDLGECVDDGWFSFVRHVSCCPLPCDGCEQNLQSRIPKKLFVRDRIAVVHATPVHMLESANNWAINSNSLDMRREMFRSPCGGVIFLETVRKAFEPAKDTVEIVLSAFGGDDTFENDIAVSDQLVSPVAIFFLHIDSRL